MPQATRCDPGYHPIQPQYLRKDCICLKRIILLFYKVMIFALHFAVILGPIHTIPDSAHIGLLPISDRPSIHTIPDESDMIRIAFAEQNHSAVKVVCIGLLSISDHF